MIRNHLESSSEFTAATGAKPVNTFVTRGANVQTDSQMLWNGFEGFINSPSFLRNFESKIINGGDRVIEGGVGLTRGGRTYNVPFNTKFGQNPGGDYNLVSFYPTRPVSPIVSQVRKP